LKDSLPLPDRAKLQYGAATWEQNGNIDITLAEVNALLVSF